MSTQATETCQVCEKRTIQRCSSCKAVYFCSAEHQKLAWPCHRWLCTLPLGTFSLPPLSASEADYLVKYPERNVMIISMEWRTLLERGGLWQQDWTRETLVRDLKERDCTIPEPLRSRTIATLHMYRKRSGLFSRNPEVFSPWIYVGACVDEFFVAYEKDVALLPSGSNVFDTVSPVLRQFALFWAMREANKKGKAPTSSVELAGRRTLEALSRLSLPAMLKENFETQLFIPISTATTPELGLDDLNLF
ncbi:hypothetical protein JCM6882_005764 [Rhodosporidiobolus microsporus]